MLPILACESFLEIFKHHDGAQEVEASFFRDAFYKQVCTFSQTSKQQALQFALDLARSNLGVLVTTSESTYKIWVNIETACGLYRMV